MNRQFDYANVKNPEYFCDGRMEALPLLMVNRIWNL